MLNWVEYWKELLGRIGEIGQITPDIAKGYKTLSATMTGSLDARTRELIALAMVVTTRCDDYIIVHTTGATKHGATYEEIADALSAAIPLNVGTALACSARVLDAVRTYEKA